MRGWFVWLVCAGGCASGFIYDDANNYTYEGALTVKEVPVQPQSDLTIDWSALTTDIRGRPADPASIEQLTIVGFSEPFDTLLPKVERNEVGQSDAQEIYLFDNSAGAQSALLSEFAITGIPMNIDLMTVDPEVTWFLSLLNLPDGRTDILSSIHLVPTDGETSTLATFDDASSKLDVTVDIHSAPRIEAKAGKRYIFDWQSATEDVFGHPFDDQLGDEIIIAHYATSSVEEIEAEFLRLDTFADELYRANVFSLRALSLDEAVDSDGNNFAGFTAEGTWLIGIICTTCTTPIPFLLSAVDVK